MNSRTHTAIHEAGHAVIGRVLGMVCGDASIEQDSDSAGHAIIGPPYATLEAWLDHGKFRELSSVFVGRTLALMAGREAEEECLGHSELGDGGDLNEIGVMWPYLPCVIEDDDQYEGRLRARTRGLIRRHRRVIERVAADLIAGSALSADEVDAIVYGECGLSERSRMPTLERFKAAQEAGIAA